MEQCGGLALVAIQDNGVGIRSNVLPHIFELFAQHGVPQTEKQMDSESVSIWRSNSLRSTVERSMRTAQVMASAFTVRLPIPGVDECDA
jgi:hypothetical protein